MRIISSLFPSIQAVAAIPLSSLLPDASARLSLAVETAGRLMSIVEGSADERGLERRLVEAEIAQGAILSPAGWRRQLALAAGELSRRTAVVFPERDLLPPHHLNYSRNEAPMTSYLPNVMGLLVFLEGIAAIRRHPEKQAKENIFRRTLAGLHEANRNEVRVEGVEKLAVIVEGSPVLWSAFPHTNVFFDLAACLVHRPDGLYSVAANHRSREGAAKVFENPSLPSEEHDGTEDHLPH